MRRKIRLGLVIVVFTLLFCMFGIGNRESEAVEKGNGEVAGLIEYETSEIKEIFEANEAYSYLPEIAKDYVATVYEETGEIIKTEKNKEKGEVYLNPAYVKYLALDDIKKQEQDVIPLPNVIDYNYDYDNQDETGANLGSRFSLADVNGVSRISRLKNQGNLGICWAFASAEQAESNIYIKKNINTNTALNYPVFSARQLDYAISINGILNYDNSANLTFIPRRTLAYAGTILDAPFIYTSGLATVFNDGQVFADDNDSIYNSMDKKTLSSVLNYEKSQYEVNKFTLFPTFLFRNESQITNATEKAQYLAEKNAFLNSIKTAIVENGGTVITTQSPQRTCEGNNLATGYTGTRIIRVDDSCYTDAGHAMHIIGWDDNYKYTYQTCNGYNQLYGANIVSHKNEYMSCSSNVNTVSGTGAWIVRNSWGNIGNGYDYVYVAYDSLYTEILSMSDFTEMKKVEDGGERKWDNVYHGAISVMEPSTGSYSYSYSYADSRAINIPKGRTEKIEKIKFFAYGKEGLKYVFYYTDNKGTTHYLKDKSGNNITVTMADVGLKTVDFSGYDIVLDDTVESVSVAVTTSTYSVVIGGISVFTSNVSSTPEIYMPDSIITLNNGEKLTNTILSTTRGIKSNSKIIYKLYDGKENDRTSQYNLRVTDDDRVAINNVNSTLSSGALSNGAYALEVSYDSGENGVARDFELIKVGNGSVTIRYAAGSNGTVNASSTTIDAISGTPKTVVATANSGYEFKKWVDESGNEIANEATLTTEMQKNRFGFYGEHTYTAIFDVKAIIPEFSVSGDYVYDKNEKIVDGISEKTKVSDFKTKLSINNPFIIKIFDKNKTELSSNEMIGTGSMIRIIDKNTGKVEDTIINIVRGDANGDGKINSSDYVTIKKYIMSGGGLDGAYLKAADFNKSGGANASDYVEIKIKIMK